MKVDDLRDVYLAFFERHGHQRVPSDSLVPQNDPTLLFTGAGMNQFKENFLGLKKDLRRAVSSQKCLRTGDLDHVGKTPYHHSFFEMLGNFSFGDYFKREAIGWAWELLTQELKIPKERLRVSVHRDDEEACRIWKDEVRVPEAWISRLGDKSNFWPSNAPQDGPNGPCGPCSEIYYDQGSSNCPDPARCSIECDCGRFAEIWNLVFTQFDRQDGGVLAPLAQKNIDTGMGLERLACVLQNQKTNFEIDTFQKINRALEEVLGTDVRGTERLNLYAISDHLRASVFAIGDGVIPSNEGRGYVIRKLIRRAIWQARELAPRGRLKEPFLYQAVRAVAEVMKKTYPEILQASDSIAATLQSEEARFLNTLETGLERLQDRLERLQKDGSRTLPGTVSFELYDTYGFPEELTRRIAEREGFEIDTAGFESLMEEQRRRAKEATPISGAIFVSGDLDQKLAGLPATKFLGYDTLSAAGTVLFSSFQGGQGILVTDQTPFYAESGGQVGDTGRVSGPHLQARVADVQKKDKCFIHTLHEVQGSVSAGERVQLDVDAEHRFRTMRHHTATHLLHAALRKMLGTQVRQLGSLVSPEKLRFDYSYASALTPDQIRTLEDSVNREIWANTPVSKIEKPIEAAREEGAIAFFGEKYGERVRVVTVENFSKELCGGTHCDRTGQIGFFVITSESSVASGTRRIEAKTGEAALAYLRTLRDQISEASQLLRTSPAELPSRIVKLQETVKKMEKERSKASAKEVSPQRALEHATMVASSVRLAVHHEKETDLGGLRALSDALKGSTSKTVYLLSGEEGEKLHVILGMSPDLRSSGIDLRTIWKEIAPLAGASGGGRSDLIQAGGKNQGQLPAQTPEIQNKLAAFLKQSIKA